MKPRPVKLAVTLHLESKQMANKQAADEELGQQASSSSCLDAKKLKQANAHLTEAFQTFSRSTLQIG